MSKQALALKYRPKDWNDVVQQGAVVQILSYMIDHSEFPNCMLFAGAAGCGKAQPLDSLIFTENGFLPMKDMKVGTRIWGEDGKLHTIVGVFPQGKKLVYKIYFKDGSYTKCSDEHLWQVKDLRPISKILKIPHSEYLKLPYKVRCTYAKNRVKVVDTNYLINEGVYTPKTSKIKGYDSGSYNFEVPVTAAFEMNEQYLPIDPYLLGCLLGDGCICSGNFSFSNVESDIVSKVAELVSLYDCELVINAKDHGIKTLRPDKTNILRDKLKDLGLWGTNSHTKFIPEIYMKNSFENRLKLLQGILDTDGDSSKGINSIIVGFSNENLTKQVFELAISLGYRVSFNNEYKIAQYTNYNKEKCGDIGKYKQTSPFWSGVIFYDRNILPVTSIKHINRIPKYTGKNQGKCFNRKKIKRIEKIGYEECQCIMTDNPSGLYITDSGIVTHNTTSARIMANKINKGKGSPIEIDAASNNGVEQIRDIAEKAKFRSIDSEYKVFIIDECFHKDTLVSTVQGYKKISDIIPGDEIFNLTGKAVVKKVFKNKVPKSSLVLLKISNNEILTTKDHLFFTDDGWVEAKNLKIGEVLYDRETMYYLRENISNVSERFKKNMFQRVFENIPETKIAGSCKIKAVSEVRERMSNLSQEILDLPEYEFKNLFKRMWEGINETKYSKVREGAELLLSVSKGIHLPSLWKEIDISKFGYEKNLLSEMCKNLSNSDEQEEKISSINRNRMRYMWEQIFKTKKFTKKDMFEILQKQINISQEQRKSIYSKSVRFLEKSKSDEESRLHRKDEEDKREKWYTSLLDGKPWREWSLYSSSNSFERRVNESAESRVDIRVCSSNKDSERNGVSYQLQNRPCLSRFEVGDRGGWQFPLYEISTVERQKESEFIGKSRVEDIKILELGNNEQLFSSYFDDSERDSEFITMYDLEVDGHPSYFVEDILVHNCHMISTAGWNSALKLIEEPPAKTIFIFCTTNPEKIPETIHSRVQRFDFNKITFDGITNRLEYIINEENKDGDNITFEKEAIDYIAKISEGGLRNAITMMDKCISYSKQLTVNNVIEALGVEDYELYFKLVSAMLDNRANDVISIIEKLYLDGKDLKLFIKQYISFLLDLCKYSLTENFNFIDIPMTYRDKLECFNDDEIIEINNYRDKIIDIYSLLRWESSPKLLIESTLLDLTFQGGKE